MAGFDYNAAATALVTVLQTANTTTATQDLSGSLTTRLVNDNITDDDPQIVNVRADRLPAIYVRVNQAEEDFAGLGDTGSTRRRKSKTVDFDIFALYRKEGARASNREVSRDVAQLAQNIEAVLQANAKLASPNLWCNPGKTTFAGFPLAEGSWVKAVLIEVKAQYHFR